MSTRRNSLCSAPKQRYSPSVCRKIGDQWRYVATLNSPPSPDPAAGMFASWLFLGPDVYYPDVDLNWSYSYNWLFLTKFPDPSRYNPVPIWWIKPLIFLVTNTTYIGPVA